MQPEAIISTITLAVMNGEHDFGGHGTPAWNRVYTWLNDEIRPDILLLQEATHARKDGRRGFYAAKNKLGMNGFLAEASTLESPNPPAVLVRPSKLTIVAEYPQLTNWWHPAAQGRVTRAGHSGGPELSLASVHLCCHSPTYRLGEAELAIRWGKTGQQLEDPNDPNSRRLLTTDPCIIGGDFNSYSSSPHELAPLPDLVNIADKHHTVHRTLPDRTTPDTRPWDTLTTAGYTDLALHAYLALKQAGAMSGTSHRRTDQGADPALGQQSSRIDFGFANGAIPKSLISADVITDPMRDTDHKLLLYVFDEESFWDSVEETVRPRPAAA
ncbi:endonuclease/exonuclease/phosphatase family protein [Kitasatospora sp. NPDC088548]|uniref:endonuclease/exonuclease/phosphatase family protein n=1 Tax=Kitasatospora sp. NPDC088548 TaxID=3364075 RepID=UPI00380C6F66